MHTGVLYGPHFITMAIALCPTPTVAQDPVDVRARAARKKALPAPFNNARRSVAEGLAWLRDRQTADGSWRVTGATGTARAGGDPALLATALALHAFTGDGHSLDAGTHRAVVERATAWLTGRLRDDGSFGLTGRHAVTVHAIATWALGEAVGISETRAPAHLAGIKAALRFLAAAANEDGGWSNAGRGQPSELQATMWAVHALHCGSWFEFRADPEALRRAKRWLLRLDLVNGLPHAPHAPATGAGTPDRDVAATALLADLCGVRLRSSLLFDGVAAALNRKPAIPSKARPGDPLYLFLGGTATRRTDTGWPAWAERVLKKLARMRVRSAGRASWPPNAEVFGMRSAVLQTALSVLTLETLYRDDSYGVYTPQPPAPHVGLGGGAGGKWGGRRGGRSRLLSRKKHAAWAIERAERWLWRQQHADGNWSAGTAADDRRVVITGLVLLGFVGDGSTLRSGDYDDVVRKAVDWLCTRAGDRGNFGLHGPFATVDQAIAVYALAEALGLSKPRSAAPAVPPADAAGSGGAAADRRRHAVLRTCLAALSARQNSDGGWNIAARGGPSEMMPTVWSVLALHSARLFRLGSHAAALQRATAWMGQQAPFGRSLAPVRAPAGVSSRDGDAAAALFAHFFLGQSPRDNETLRNVAMQVAEVERIGTPADPLRRFFLVYARYQVGGRSWQPVTRELDALASAQVHAGASGHWKPTAPLLGIETAVAETAVAMLTLQAYYRYTRLVR